ncbi:hypothetical protein JIMMER1_102 [Brevibacillus phage Jimmer1]|uniref:Uncharacterized protein n=4 Tax=Jimmervirus TaxID=1984788 RepID=S5M5J1_9CAUD|nr:hypothetical protein AVV10_gp102 [Brevibacillus phage Osiris]YP_009226412.1 hypothetical protein AXJ21_gp102 [Brevibacillus phage Jimmer1]YP_009606529.1 hypothetical protein FDI01_gp102 [Brevibacillus phage Jimmer2]ALA48112.1 hypothetical protein POWDER_102 [Brevibacillus phage Powder]AGR47231.1 hypothetical protein JIMMER2_102 [Brevibacillus phage Jimmer2]AGR47330.1 hypothetical protein JIMMER1_102 [Brevibacillus phage Jimmer1]ALA07408.1 hypothetical protein OSIRIS_102 [Brevibacillus phag
MGGAELKIVSFSDKEIELIISALDYQNYEFATYEDDSGHYDLKLKLEQRLNQPDSEEDIKRLIKEVGDKLGKGIKEFEHDFEETQERMKQVREKMDNWEPRLIRKR